ncbi:hypothetical protein P171DRAFT_436650 [Karstenula rhodostoma CBS 690.94]|uniref:Uncharacterized protein n=1 Tax=Karstenula rhodostoma CBS 690.94 TaxID=1392251 RepID=A0A9P4P925_9PLEO|nr:hypothetical protein P171DRAFT_436650 [Karstenula rhodostoma CBS 690.94]
MPALTQPAMQNLQSIKRALSDPDTAADLLQLIARKASKVGKSKGKKKIKGGAIAGIVIGIIVVVIIAAIILLLLRRRAKKRQITSAPARV